MEVRFSFQNKNNNSIKDVIEIEVAKKPKRIYCVLGKADETGINALDYEFTGIKANIVFVLGIDRKDTTKRMLELLMANSKQTYVYTNNSEVEFSSGIMIFENTSEAVIVTMPLSLTLSQITSNDVFYSTTVYDLKNKCDKSQYDDIIKKISGIYSSEKYVLLTTEYIGELIANKEIFSMKQYTHNLMSIAEFKKQAGTDDVDAKVKKEVAKAKKKMQKEKDIEIDLSSLVENDEIQEDETNETIEVIHDGKKELEKIDLEQMVSDETSDINVMEEEDSESYSGTLDIENMLFEKSDIKLNRSKAKPVEQEIAKNRKIDISKVTNIIMQLPSKVVKGKDINCIKIPNYIKELIPNFFEIMDDTRTKKTNEGNFFKKGEITVELLDLNNNLRSKTKGYMYQQDNQTYISIHIEGLYDIKYEDLDIARIIKMSKDSYHVEIIPKTTEEYTVWDKLCTQEFRGNERRYGII